MSRNETIDTSTTAGKIAVMQAFVNGKKIQYRWKDGTFWHDVSSFPCWNWDSNDYRIKVAPSVELERERLQTRLLSAGNKLRGEIDLDAEG